MKWVKVAIGAVIAIISIGIIATSVYNMTQEKVINDVTEITSTVVTDVPEPVGSTVDVSFSPVISSDLDEYEFETLEGDTIFYIYRDGDVIFSGDVTISIGSGSNDYTLVLNYDNTTGTIFLRTEQILRFTVTVIDYTTLAVGDTITIVVDNSRTTPPQLTGINATLLMLTPLIFAGGVLAYLLNKQNY